MLKHSNLINGYDTFNLTKLDILDDLEEIKVGVTYKVDGKELEGFPGLMFYSLIPSIHKTDVRCILADLEILSRVEVEYVTLPGWKTSITQARTYDALPENCKKYVEFIESRLSIPIEWVGVGPERESMLKKELKKD